MKKLISVLFLLAGVTVVASAETYQQYHDRLTDCYYNKKPFNGKVLTKSQFEKYHNANWKNLENYRIKNVKGYKERKEAEEAERKIQEESQRIIREQAIENLRKRGEIQ